ncbi:ATP-binding protein [Mycolicibacterium sp. 120270]|uniref:ATP-binding protein n=1 Tax=Mycolicibacterium sp. 120270 TaxID=3090600 RepID=UPI00299E9676|nr:adenylate/guanylate cyclase domain-containing protein [Mycolicibacterium sp. 120270]MDX1887211.1 adenylate/guanylate cyclase domain-containing protein [Mycolicibacterium sp. 120270]
MALSCGVCGAGLRDAARFCDTCGSPVVADSRAEYKQVTVLFADVVRSMDIAAAVGPERLREIMGELFRRSSVIVQRYGGTVDKFTGDGIMAVFGAPVALEDHAVRACRAALDIQTDAKHLAAEVDPRDGISLQLRIGLNSGEVITGEIGSGPMSYTAIGEQVGMAQRMESVAPPGGVMVSDSTARLVDTTAMLGATEQVHIKGAVDPVPAHQVFGMATGPRPDRAEPTFIGREWEIAALNGVLDRAINGKGGIVGLVGPAGIGKSRIVRELTKRARDAGAEVYTTYCESHTTDLPFHAAAGLLRSTTGTDGLDGPTAREHVRVRFPDANDEDLLLLDDLLGIGDPEASLPQIDPDARRRRISAVVKAATLARGTPVMFVIEDAHWIDAISEAMLAEFLTVIPQTPSLVVVTYRPEYDGALAHAPRAQTIVLEPLDDAQMRALGAELLGEDRSVAELTDLITERAAGNPFFAEEIVRDLSERDVLVGGRGCFLCTGPVADVHVPRTLQAVIAARIDRLDPAAKRTLNAAAVIGSRFTPDMLRALEVDASLDELLSAELIDQTALRPEPEYAFRHPLIRAVAYESQLRSDRAQLHKRLAAAVDENDQNAALIAEHLEAAEEPRKAYEWHMRAGAWSTNRDHAAAHISWERAIQVADSLPDAEPDVLAMRIAPRSFICSNAFRRIHPDLSARFDELRGLCAMAGDKPSLAIGTAGLVMEHLMKGRMATASQLSSENMALIESIDDPVLTSALSFTSCVAKFQVAELDEVMRWSQAVIDGTDDQATPESIILGSPLAMHIAFRGVARWQIGLPGWREDIDQAIAMSRVSDAVTHTAVIGYCYLAIPYGVLLPDDSALDVITAATQMAERSAEDIALVMMRMTMGFSLAEGRNSGDVQRGHELLAELGEMCAREQYAMNIIAPLELYKARTLLAGGNIDEAVDRARFALDEILRSGNIINHPNGVVGLVEMLLARGAPRDLDEAEAAIDRLETTLPARRWAMRDIFAIRARTLLARARGDKAAYRDHRDRYRAVANELGYQGHMLWAAELP